MKSPKPDNVILLLTTTSGFCFTSSLFWILQARPFPKSKLSVIAGAGLFVAQPPVSVKSYFTVCC